MCVLIDRHIHTCTYKLIKMIQFLNKENVNLKSHIILLELRTMSWWKSELHWSHHKSHDSGVSELDRSMKGWANLGIILFTV